MFKRPHLIGFGLVAVLALFVLNLPSQTTARLKLALSGLFLPLFGLASSAQKLGESGGLRLLSKSTLISQLEKLERENEELRLQVMQGEETIRENAVLRDALQWQPRLRWKARLARVITRDPANWWRSVQIDLGANAGLVKDMPVITSQGLVGRIQDVGSNSSQVALLGDSRCQVPAVIDNSSRDKGILRPGEASVLDESIVELAYLPRGSQAVPGQKVFTSGLGGIFPAGIPIGQITDTNSVSYGLYLEARVKLFSDLRELEEVWVVYP
jgi:rod shape-determining protein MreC